MPMTTVIQFPERDSTPLSGRVSEEVRALMGRHGVSQIMLAAWLGINQSGLSQRLTGKVRWSLPDIELIAEGFGVHPAVLMGGYAATPPAPKGGIPILRARRDSNPKPSDPKVLPLRIAA